MDYLIFTYKGNPRDLRKIILAILKSGSADNIKKINYVHNYSIKADKIEKNEEKILLIHSENQDKLIDFLSKNFPQIKKLS